MKCPKCQYISFDSPERCRNCGYDFSLAPSVTPPEPPLQRPGDADGPFVDLSLNDTGRQDTPARPRARSERLDLPLFNEPVPGLDDTPLISAPSAPRAPLAVRKATPDPSRVPRPPRAARRAADGRPESPERAAGVTPATPIATRPAPPPPIEPPAELFANEPAAPVVAPPVPRQPDLEPADSGPGTPAPPAARLVALAVDSALLLGINLVVVHFTLSILRYPWSRLAELPMLPLVAFCLMLDAGYLLAFTVASGQTIGKMLAGVRVVTDESWRVPVTQAAIRTAIAPLSVLALGLGYLPALVGRDRRALHDRLSNTRVVRA